MSEESNFFPNQTGTITVRVDRSATEQKLIDEKEAVQKQLQEMESKNRELEEKVTRLPKPTGAVPLDSNQFNHGEPPRQGFKDYAEMTKFLVQNANKDEAIKEQYDALFLRSLNSMQGETWVLDSSLADLANGKGRWKLGKNQNGGHLSD